MREGSVPAEVAGGDQYAETGEEDLEDDADGEEPSKNEVKPSCPE